jgi:hypothetical protein
VTTQIKVSRGARTERDCTARTDQGVPVVGVFTGDEPTSGLIWPAGGSPDNALPVVPTVAWTSGPDGTFTVVLTSAMTAALPPGNYWLRASATVGSDRVDLMIAELTVVGMGATLAPQVDTGAAGPTADDLGLLPTLYCTDEHIAIRCGPDFTSLLPDSQLLAWGNDGVFGALDSWTLTSVSTDFDVQLSPIWYHQSTGLTDRIGYVCWLRRPQSAFPAGGHLMGIAATDGSSLTLRRVGMAVNQGQAPSPAAGLLGVSFNVATFRPQIEEATYDLNQQYSIDDAVLMRSPTYMTDMRVLRRACVCKVLLDRYSDASRVGTGDYGYKVDLLKAELGGLQDTLEVRWGPQGQNSIPPSSIFTTRLVR